MHVIAHDIDPKQAQSELRKLTAVFDAHEGGDLPLDTSQGAPTQISLQLCLSAMLEAAARDIAITPGPDLQALLDRDTGQDSRGADQ